MDFQPLPFDAPLNDYEQQAASLLEAYRAGDPRVIDLIHHSHPRFLDEKVPWLPKRVSRDEILSAGLDIRDARLALARRYDFLDWESLNAHVQSVAPPDSPVRRFEAAVDAVVDGRLEALRSLLKEDPELVRARSARVCHFDPPVHRATLLNYVAANGVEGYRQKTPPNAVEVARELLVGGAEVDAPADLYGGQWTTMGLLVSSSHPAEAGLQVALAEVLLEFGADVNDSRKGWWRTPLMTALIFGYPETAEALASRGARVDTVAAAAGLGRVEEARRLLPSSDAEARHWALALAAQSGRSEAVELLLEAGEDPNRFNPKGGHAHATPLHQAVWGGHEDVVRTLVEHGARLDIEDQVHRSTPLGWAVYGGRQGIAEYLRSRGAG